MNVLMGFLLFLATLLPLSAYADNYPTRTITLVVPFPAGTTTDAQARIIGEFLSARLGRAIVIENKTGADGKIAADYAYRAQPDGYTLITMTNGMCGRGPIMRESQLCDLSRLTPIGGLGRNTQLLIVRSDLMLGANPVKTASDLIAYARKNPGVTVGRGGTSGRISSLLFQKRAAAGVEFRDVPYRGDNEVLTNLLGGHIGAAFLLTGTPGVLDQIRSGRLRPLAVIDTTRSGLVPDVPSIVEAYPDLAELASIGPRGTIAGPPNLPREIAALLSRELKNALGDSKIVEKFSLLGADPNPMTEEENAAYLTRQAELWEKIVREENISQ